MVLRTGELTDAMRPLVEHHNALRMANHDQLHMGTADWLAHLMY
jgi:hypothetical protein